MVHGRAFVLLLQLSLSANRMLQMLM